MPKIMGVHSYSFLIFDRWGKKLFETHELEQGWNGTFHESICPNDVYVYKVTFVDDVQGRYGEYEGKVMLLK